MIQSIWIIALVLTGLISLSSLQWGILIYPIVALVLPTLKIGNIAIRFELIYCLWLIFLLFIYKSTIEEGFKWQTILSVYTLFLIEIMGSTGIALYRERAEGSISQLLIQFYGMLRPLLVMFLFLNVSIKNKNIYRLLLVFVCLSIPISLLSIGQTLGIGFVQEITLNAYTSPWRSPVFDSINKHGVIFRSTSVFESPVYNAVYLLIVLITSIYLSKMNRSSTLHQFMFYPLIGLVFMAGITTISSTFLIGIVIIIFLFYFLWGISYPQRLLHLTIGIFILVIVLYFLLMPEFLKNPSIKGGLHYQVERIFQGEVLKTRYDRFSGIFTTTYQAIAQQPITGWGVTKARGSFVGDSIYITLLYQSGVLGLNLWLFLIFLILYYTWDFKEKQGLYGNIKQLVFLYTILLLAVGVGSPSFYILRLQEWYWALVGLSLNPHLQQSKD